MRHNLTLFSLLIISACGGSGGSNNSQSDVTQQKQFVQDVMSDYYLYYDLMPDIDIGDYNSPEVVLTALLVNPPDRFSYIGNRVAQQNFFQAGTYEGIGYYRKPNGDNTDTILYVFDDSAAGRSCPGSATGSPCLQRGDIVLNSIVVSNNV